MPTIIVSMSLPKIIRVTQIGIIPFIASAIAVRLTRSLSANTSIMERRCDGYFFDMKFSKKPTNAVSIKINNAIFLLLNTSDIAITSASTHLSHVTAKKILSFLIFNLIWLLLAYVDKARRQVQRHKFCGDIREIFRKIFFNISLLITNTEERLKEKIQFEDYKEIVFKIHQYDNFCRRVISKRNLVISKGSLIWSFLGLLIHGQRELYHLNKFLDSNKINFKDFEFYNYLKDIFNLLSEAYIKKDMTKLERIHELEKTIIYEKFYKLIQKNSKENIVLYHIAVSIRNFYLAASPLIGIIHHV